MSGIAEKHDKFIGEAKKCRILQVAGIPATFEKLLVPLIHSLKESGFDVDLCCGEGEYLEILRNRGYKVTTIPFSRKAVSLDHYRTFLYLYRLLIREKYDIVHFHTPIISAIGRAAARLAGVPVIIYTAHGFYFHDKMNTFEYNTFLWVEKVLARKATDWLFLVSKEDESLAREKKFIHREERIIWIGNGVESKRFISNSSRKAWRSQNGFSEHDILLCFVGRVVREKGVLDLIEAFSRIRKKYEDVFLLIVGSTLSSDRDKTIIWKANEFINRHTLLDKVRFLGFRDDIEKILDTVDIFVLPSYREGLPRSIIEAMMSGKPVIATNIRGCREEVVHGETGLLVSPGNVGELASAIETLILNPELARTMGKKGRERAIALYDERYTLERQLNVYKKVVEELETYGSQDKACR